MKDFRDPDNEAGAQKPKTDDGSKVDTRDERAARPAAGHGHADERIAENHGAAKNDADDYGAEGAAADDYGAEHGGPQDSAARDYGGGNVGEEQGDRASGAEPPIADEAEILRSELMRLQEELSEANARLEEMKDRFLRARSDLENYRKRAAGDAERARDAGLDSAVLPVLAVFDDLRRALDAVDEADPSKIVPGVESVLSTLERNLEALGIKTIGNVGEPFDPDLHEALTSVATSEAEKLETIAEVFQLGFKKGERLIRPARVVVYQS